MEARGAGVKQLQHAHVYIHSGSYKISIKRLSLFNIATSSRPTIDARLGVGMVGGDESLDYYVGGDLSRRISSRFIRGRQAG